LKKQIILISSGILLVIALFFLGKTVSDSKPVVSVQPQKTQSFDIEKFISKEKNNLTLSQLNFLSRIEDSSTSSTNKINTYNSLATFWKDSIHLFEPFAYYTEAAAKLDNSEKSLTFAAQIFLDGLRGEDDLAKVEWESAEAISLFEKALALNPENDNLKIALASCYIYGKGRSGDPQETMKGIQQLLSVVRKDSTNMKAQMVLGVGGYVSGQYDKAIARLKKVVTAEPDNFEATAFLADTYAAQGNKEEAIKWYNVSKRLSNNPEYNNEVDNRIKTLQKN
jgi:tetratricopeptide (TPR) repeat protein